ncbi:MAG: hypothetical protein WDW36_010074 [Sanguina aurantia]
MPLVVFTWPAAIVAAVAAAVPQASPPAPPSEKTVHDVLAGAMARAASQGTIHPLDTMKVRLQTASRQSLSASAVPVTPARPSVGHALSELGSLYKGVVGAATGAGIIIGTYFAFYSTTKRFLRERTDMSEGSLAFAAGATAALGSSVVKVPIAVCIRSVQAGVYPNALAAAKAITSAAGARGLFTGFVPTLLEDVPDMAVKFAVYESLRGLHLRLNDGQPPSVIQDLLMGGTAGAAAAAATTPLDVVKTRMMVSASSSPGLRQCVASVVAEGTGVKAFFCGVGPRALSNGLNSAIFFCFFEAIRRVRGRRGGGAEGQAVPRGMFPGHGGLWGMGCGILNTRHAEAEALRLSQATSRHSRGLGGTSPSHSIPGPSPPPQPHNRNSHGSSGSSASGASGASSSSGSSSSASPAASSSSTGAATSHPVSARASSPQGSGGSGVMASVKLKSAVGTGGGGGGGGGARMACLSLALPLHAFPRPRCQEL